MSQLNILLQNSLDALKLELTAEQIAQLMAYTELLFQWNKVYNLTACEQMSDFIPLHLIDSLLAGKFLLGDAIIDVGTGAGLPGIPLAIYFPNKHFTLLDSRGKKIRFLHSVIETLKLKNVTLVNQRVEDYQPDARFTTVITRAFAHLGQMLQVTEHLCDPKGLFLAMKGRYPITELASVPPNFVITLQQPVVIPGIEQERHIIGLIHK